jgi:hypothetical protein
MNGFIKTPDSRAARRLGGFGDAAISIVPGRPNIPLEYGALDPGAIGRKRGNATNLGGWS